MARGCHTGKHSSVHLTPPPRPGAPFPSLPTTNTALEASTAVPLLRVPMASLMTQNKSQRMSLLSPAACSPRPGRPTQRPGQSPPLSLSTLATSNSGLCRGHYQGGCCQGPLSVPSRSVTSDFVIPWTATRQASVLHHLPGLTQTHAHRISDAIRPSCPAKGL